MKHVPEALCAFFSEHPKIALAFSGGCDSAYLMYAAKACGADVRAYYVRSQFQPAFELEDALRLSEALNCIMKIIDMDVLADEKVRSNPSDRCYHCKQRIFSAILSSTEEDGYSCIIDGTNASDDASDRPGMRAIQEMHVLSPLRCCGISKAEVRCLSKEAGLFTWNKPAYACLATRIPSCMAIDAEILGSVERAEENLSRMGFSDFRVRVTGNGARLEITEEQLPLLIEKRKDIISVLEADFPEICLNLRVRTN